MWTASAINTDVRQPDVDDSGVYPAKYIVGIIPVAVPAPV